MATPFQLTVQEASSLLEPNLQSPTSNLPQRQVPGTQPRVM
jgi:hypothetical protein